MDDPYPPPAFHFEVLFPDAPGQAVSFQEVSGIRTELDTEVRLEGADNGFLHRLPRGVRHANLILRRGLASRDSALVSWCASTLDGDLSRPIVPRQVDVWLMDETATVVRGWSFANAFPVRWEVDPVNATGNEVAIEVIELSYTYYRREL